MVMKSCRPGGDYPFYVVGPGTTFSRQHPEHADLRIWGLNAFDPSRAIYFYHAWNGDVVAVKPRSVDAIQRKLPSVRCNQGKRIIATLVSIKPFPGLHLTTTRDNTGRTKQAGRN